MGRTFGWQNSVAYLVGFPLAVLGGFTMSGSLEVSAHVVALGCVLLFGFGFGGDLWLVRLPVAVMAATVLLAWGFHGVSGVFALSLIALAIAVLSCLLWYAVFRIWWAGYPLVFLVLCVIVAERAIAFGVNPGLAALGWIAANIVGLFLIAYAAVSAGEQKRAR